MKKVSLILISLLLCLSMVLVGCNASKEKQTVKPTNNVSNEQNGENNTPAPPVCNLDKEALIADFNAIDLGAMLESLEGGEESPIIDYASLIMASMTGGEVDPQTLMSTFLPLLTDVAAGIDASMELDGESATATLAVKDGIAYIKAVNITDERVEGYLCFGKGELMLFVQNPDGSWEATDLLGNMGGEIEEGFDDSYFEDEIDLMSDFEENGDADMMAMVKEMIAAVVIPELKAEHLTEENGMLVLSNEYLVELACANAGLLGYGNPDYEVPAEEIEDGAQEMRDSLSTVGLKIAFNGNEKTITKLKISFAIDDSEEGKEIIANSSLAAGSIELNISADGMRLESVKYSVTGDYSREIDGCKPTSTIEEKYIYDDAGIICGVEVKADVTALISRGISYEEDENYNYISESVSMAVKIESSIKLDMSKIGKTNQDVLSFDLDMSIDKAAKVTTESNWSDMDAEEKITSSALPESEYGEYFDAVDMSFKLTSTDANKLAFKGEMTPDKGEGKVEFAATIYLNNILNFPTSVPSEVTGYMTAE